MEQKTIHITSVINKLVRTFIKKYDGQVLHNGGILNCSSAYDINNGLCDEFATDVLKAMGYFKNHETREKVFDLSSDMFMNYDIQFATDEWGELIIDNDIAWSKDMFEWYGYPPKLIDLPSHVWIFFEGKHYDAECPVGVNYWFELPIFIKLFQ